MELLNPVKVQCTGTTVSGRRCGKAPIAGATVCRLHGGAAPQVKAKAAVRAELASWGLDAPTVDPGETLLRLVSQSAARARRYAAELEDMVAGHDNLRDALIREAHGEFGPVGEYARGLVVLEAQERERCASWCVKAIAAGLAERVVRVAEQEASIAERALLAAMADLGLTAEQQRHASERMAHHLRLVS